MAGTNYIDYDLNLTNNQLEKIKNAYVLRISKDNRKGDVHKIPLTNRQINKINKAKNAVILSLSTVKIF